MWYPPVLVKSTISHTTHFTQVQSFVSVKHIKSQAWVMQQHTFNPSPGCSSESKAASPFPTAMVEAAVAAAAAAVVGCVTPTPRAWCHGSPSCWTNCTPPDSTSTRPGTSASSSWISASSSACLNRTQKRSVDGGSVCVLGGWGGGGGGKCDVVIIYNHSWWSL